MGQKKSKFSDPMGGSVVTFPDIPPESPLGRMITYWDSWPCTQGKSREKMVNYCIKVWGGREIRRDGLFWPIFGTFEDRLCEALNEYTRDKKPLDPEESEYASLWVTSETRMHLYPLREKRKTNKKNVRIEETPISPPPYIPPAPVPAPAPPVPIAPIPTLTPSVPMGPVSTLTPSAPTLTPSAPTGPVSTLTSSAPTLSMSVHSESDLSTDSDISLTPSPSPSLKTPKRVTRSQTKREKVSTSRLYPLRETAMGGPQPGVGFVSVPLHSGDVREFKKEMGSLLGDPLGVAERLDQFLGPNLYTWDEIQSILKILFTVEERDMIRQAGMRNWEARHQNGPAGDVKWPLQRPNWNNQDPGDRANMSDLRDIIIQGIKESVPRGKNINKAFNEYQKKDESPTDWLERLRKSLQLYSGLDPDTDLGQALLKTQFVAKSWVDIRKKLEKIDDWQERQLGELLREAQKVYVRRDEESQKKQAKIFVAAVREGQRVSENGKRGGRSWQVDETERKEGVEKRNLKDVECFYCKQKGHIKRYCRKRIRDEKAFKED